MAIDVYAARREAVGFDEVSFGYRTVRLLPPTELAAAQAGYEGAGWSSDWLVVATDDELGDPIFADLAADGLPVFSAAHGEGGWEPVQIADSFDGFVASLSEIASVAAGRENPVAAEDNPLPERDRERVLARIREANPRSDPEFWESWLEA